MIKKIKSEIEDIYHDQFSPIRDVNIIGKIIFVYPAIITVIVLSFFTILLIIIECFCDKNK